ncbi:MAG: hypothetical protein RL238_1810 [Actinomycetota bacterium]|jgi:hypothetical protein
MKIPRKVVIAGVASVLVAGMAGASAASLGVFTGNSLGSGDAIVASCDTDGIDVGYSTQYVPLAGTSEVTAVNFGNVNNGCSGKIATVTLRDSFGNVLTSQSTTLAMGAGTTFSINVPGGVSAAAVEGMSLVIAG